MLEMDNDQVQMNFDGPTRPVFDGADYNPILDDKRLEKQLGRVFEVMRDGDWLSLNDIERLIYSATGIRDPQASISAQIRHLKKKKFGSHHVERRRRQSVGTWEYRLNL